MDRIVFNHPYTTGRELTYIGEAIRNLHLSGNGPFSRRCAEWLVRTTACRAALLTHSCTGALEMAAILAELQPGDEVIMPSFTFVSTANAFVLRGAVPVFVDIRDDTLNIDERLIEQAITPRTRAIVVVHYAGVGCEMNEIMRIARSYELTVIEDAAQGLGASYNGSPLGAIGDVGALSFHETKNIMCGEGGALLVTEPSFAERAEVIHEKGTNRRKFFRGQVDKYSWVDIGSSFLLSDINAAFLWSQLECADEITAKRMAVWSRYHVAFEELAKDGFVRRPVVPANCHHNAHMYYLLLDEGIDRHEFIQRLAAMGVDAVFHYVPLHSSEAGLRFGRTSGDLIQTSSLSERLVRLPLWAGLRPDEVERVIRAVEEGAIQGAAARTSR